MTKTRRQKSERFLSDEFVQSWLAKGPVKADVVVQIPEPGDDVAGASITWPDSRTEIPSGIITLTACVNNQVPGSGRKSGMGRE